MCHGDSFRALRERYYRLDTKTLHPLFQNLLLLLVFNLLFELIYAESLLYMKQLSLLWELLHLPTLPLLRLLLEKRPLIRSLKI